MRIRSDFIRMPYEKPPYPDTGIFSWLEDWTGPRAAQLHTRTHLRQDGFAGGTQGWTAVKPLVRLNHHFPE